MAHRSDRRGDTPIRILANRAAGSIGIPARDFHRGPEHEVFCTEGPKIRMQSDYRAVSTRQHILDGRSPDTNPVGRASFLENSPIVPIAWAPGAKVQAKKVTGHLPRLAD